MKSASSGMSRVLPLVAVSLVLALVAWFFLRDVDTHDAQAGATPSSATHGERGATNRVASEAAMDRSDDPDQGGLAGIRSVGPGELNVRIVLQGDRDRLLAGLNPGLVEVVSEIGEESEWKLTEELTGKINTRELRIASLRAKGFLGFRGQVLHPGQAELARLQESGEELELALERFAPVRVLAFDGNGKRVSLRNGFGGTRTALGDRALSVVALRKEPAAGRKLPRGDVYGHYTEGGDGVGELWLDVEPPLFAVVHLNGWVIDTARIEEDTKEISFVLPADRLVEHTLGAVHFRYRDYTPGLQGRYSLHGGGTGRLLWLPVPKDGEVLVSGLPAGAATLLISNREGAYHVEQFSVTPGQTTDLGELDIRAAPIVLGDVFDSSGLEVMADVSLRDTRANRDVIRSDYLEEEYFDAHHSFQVDLQGDLRAVVEADGFARNPVPIDVLSGANVVESAAGPIDVTRVRITAQPGARLDLRLVGRGSRTLTLHEDGGPWADSVTLKGRNLSRWLKAGPYRCQVYQSGVFLYEQHITLEPEGTRLLLR